MSETVQDLTVGPAFLVSMVGARYNGIQATRDGQRFVVFTDPVTKSTMLLPEAGLTIGQLWAALQAKRTEFRVAMTGSR